ncbi:MFS family permease [Planomicrobium koreense]|uniref:MFS family permease n=1 Tax=Planococcus koreensis TaxID=112331 RepID=A0A7W8FTL1_9BACL|nr:MULTISPECIES: MFS transporter [Planococcus]MBB5181659.1 MFS family permease [Planococcus koreensis]MDN3451648.1 MFS transporter [Planococcus sp. APC 3906]
MRFFIYIIIFFAFFDLFAQLPIMSPLAVSLGATPFLAGLAVGMYSLSNIIGNIASGIFSDRKGPFAILVAGLATTGAVLFSYSFADGPYSLLAVRFVHGLAAGLTVPAAFTYLANKTASTKRGKGAAVSGAFVGLAAIIGPAYGAILASRTSVAETMATTGVLLLALAICAFFVLNRKIAKKEAVAEQPLPFSRIIRNRGLLQSFAGAFFLMFSQGVLAYMLPLKIAGLGLPPELSGLLLSVFGVAAILVFLLPVNRIFDKAKPLYTLIAGFSFMGLSLFLLSAAETAPLLYAIMCAYGIGFALLFPSINSLLIDSTELSSRGKAYGLFYAFFSLGVVGGSSFTGILELNADEGFMLSGTLLIGAALANALLSKR